MTQPLKIGWIDFGAQDRNKILSVLSLLSAPGAVDELGIGVVRDQFSDLLFPGTSTIQTRAKYFFIIPYLLMELEKEKLSNPRSLLERLSKEELSLIPVFKKGRDEAGIIGGRSGESLQRKPSSIYWTGLYTYDILHTPARISLEAFVRAVWSRRHESQTLKASGHQDKGEGTDADDAASTGYDGFWRVPYNSEWRTDLKIELTHSEAKTLKQKIITAPLSQSSLFAHLLRIDECPDSFAHIGNINLPDTLREDYQMAARFADFVYGASIRYNVILSDGRNEEASRLWEEWYGDTVRTGSVDKYDLMEPFNRLNIGERNKHSIFRFMKKWKTAVTGGELREMDQVIRDREIELKGKERAKLHEVNRINWEGNTWVGSRERLPFRYPTAQQIIVDIRRGLEGTNA